MLIAELHGKTATAITAVRALHASTQRLLVDCDRVIDSGAKSVFGNKRTHDVSMMLHYERWMPEGLFPYYREGDGAIMRCVTACFFDFDEPIRTAPSARIPGPLLLVGRVRHTAGSDPEPWDLWSA